MPIKMDRKDRLRPFAFCTSFPPPERHGCRQVLNIHRVGDWVDIDQHWQGTDRFNRRNRRTAGMRHRKNYVTGTNG